MSNLKPWKTISTKEIFKNKYMNLVEDEFETSTGARGNYYYMTRNGGDVVHALGVDREKKNFILTYQYRYPSQKFVYDVAGGGIDEDEDTKEAAVRELREETGYEGSEVIVLGKAMTEPARSNIWIHEFLVLNCEKKSESDNPELTEDTEAVLLPIVEAWDWIASNRIDSPHSISTITKALLYLGKR